MKATRARTAAIAVALAATLGCDGLALAQASSGHGAPVVRSAPASPPVSSRTHGGKGPCIVHDSPLDSGSAHGLVWVRPDPTGVVTIWLPGLNSQQCKTRRILGAQAVAEQLANGIDRGRRVSGSSYACPMDDGSHVGVYLTYPSGGDEYVDVPFTGCTWVDAPGRGDRWVSGTVDDALRALAPPAWLRYLRAAPAEPS